MTATNEVQTELGEAPIDTVQNALDLAATCLIDVQHEINRHVLENRALAARLAKIEAAAKEYLAFVDSPRTDPLGYVRWRKQLNDSHTALRAALNP